MHLTWWNVLGGVWAICVVLGVISECRSYPREARRLRDIVNTDGNSYRHSDAFANQRRTYQRKMWWQLPIGLVGVLLGVFVGLREGHWGSVVYVIGIGIWLLTPGVVAFLCLRILGPPAPTA